MQVSHVNDHVSHAVIGGMAPINFSISNSAEFFHILSSTLYSDQILAVVREVLCNAWDAHIAAGCTDKPIQITIKDNKLIIKDSGYGIHPDDMADLYATYGGTNKKNDGTQTGGFGLGCKAPFAYVDHFEVQSCHEGTKTIYNISRSCAKVMGIPSIIPIVALPTEDTGLQVTITVQSKDIARFKQLVEKIVFEGEMFAQLNGVTLETLGFYPDTKNNYLVFNQSVMYSGSKIAIRYGNVIYPVPNIKELEYEQQIITKHIAKLSRSATYNVLFQAPANSISVTPSRESISMQEHTINTLKTIFSNFITDVINNIAKNQSLYLYSRIDLLVDKREIPQILIGCSGILEKRINQFSKINNIAAWAKQSVNYHFDKSYSYVEDSVNYKIESLKQILPIKPLLLDSVVKYIDESKQTWLSKFVLLPVIKKMGTNPNLDYKRFGTVSINAVGTNTLFHVTKCTDKTKLEPEERLPYLRNIIFVSTLARLQTEVVREELEQRNLGAYSGFCFYHLSRKADEATAAKQFFKDLGMIVIDLTIAKPKVIKVAKDSNEKSETKKRNKGLPLLSEMISERGHVRMDNRFNDNVARIINPEFVIFQSKSTDNISFFGSEETKTIIKYFGSVGGVTNSMNQYDRYTDKGTKKLNEFLFNKLISHITNSKEIWEYQPHNKPVDNLHSTKQVLVKTVTHNRILSSVFGITDNRSQMDIDYLNLFLLLMKKYRYYIDYTVGEALYKKLTSTIFSEEIESLFRKVDKSPASELLATYGVSYILSCPSTKPDLKALAINLLCMTLNH